MVLGDDPHAAVLLHQNPWMVNVRPNTLRARNQQRGLDFEPERGETRCPCDDVVPREKPTGYLSSPEESPQLAANNLLPTRSRTVAVLPSLGNGASSVPVPPAPVTRAAFLLCLCRPRFERQQTAAECEEFNERLFTRYCSVSCLTSCMRTAFVHNPQQPIPMEYHATLKQVLDYLQSRIIVVCCCTVHSGNRPPAPP